MSVLLDTHTLLWLAWGDARLSPAAKKASTQNDGERFVSMATCWEMAIKSSLGKLRLGQPVGEFLSDELARNGFELLPIQLDDAAYVETLPFHHRDPFDRLLAAQALRRRVAIVSADASFDVYGVQRIW